MSLFKRSARRRSRFAGERPLLDMHYNPLARGEDGPCCGPLSLDPLPSTVLNVPAGSYEIEGSRYPLLRLVVEVLKHRSRHWIRGKGFRD